MLKNGNRLPAMDSGEGSIVVNAPVAAVYKRSLAFEDYPKFISAIKDVRRLDENHFSASLVLNGKLHEATLEIMLHIPERRLAWRTLADHSSPDHFAAGVVFFTPQSEQSTRITLKLTSSPAGVVSRWIGTCLQAFKTLLESDPARENRS